MKCLCKTVALLALVAFPVSAQAPVSNTSGFMIGVGLNGTALDGDDFTEIESGGGLTLKLGYGFSPLVTVYLGLSGAAIESVDGPDFDYAAGHLDLGLRLNLRDETKQARPFLTGGYSGIALVWDNFLAGEDLTSTGAGVQAGGGVGIFLSPKFALDIGATFVFGSLTEVKLGSATESVDLGIRTTRFDVGATFFPGGGE